MIYPAEYPPHQADAYQTTQQPIHPDMLKMAQFVRRHCPYGRTLLDVGCGSGAFLRAMQQVNPEWQVAGTDPSAAAVALVQQAGYRAYHGTLEQLDLPRQQWDAVTLWHVLEHLPDPVGTLVYIRTQLLAPQGVLFLAVPMADSWDARLFGRDWVGWELPRHFMVFTHATLQQMLATSGFKRTSREMAWGDDYVFLESLRLTIRTHIQHYTARRLLLAISYSRLFRRSILGYLLLARGLRRTSVVGFASSPK
jgi:SAM-dependent methyltransferase